MGLDTQVMLKGFVSAEDITKFLSKKYSDVKNIADYIGYSEYTITELDTRTLAIGGHDLLKEIYSHIGEYITMIIETKDG